MSPEIFISYYYKTENGDATFHTDDVKTAERLIDDDRKISHPNSFKMIIKVRGHTHRKRKLKENMKLAMDPDLLDVFTGLFQPTVMLAAAEVLTFSSVNC